MGNTAKTIYYHPEKSVHGFAGQELNTTPWTNSVVPTSVVLVVSSDVTHGLYLQTKWGCPRLLLWTCCATCPCQPAASTMPLPTGMAEQSQEGRGSLRACQYAFQETSACLLSTHSSCPFFQLSFWWAPEDQQEHSTAPHGLLSVCCCAAPTAWMWKSCRLSAATVPQPQGLAGHRSSWKPWPGTPTLSHRLGQRL